MNGGSHYVIGDAHGQFERVVELLQRAGLVDRRLGWSGADATLWSLGDCCDRGPDGIDVVHLFMRLQSEARAYGGRVRVLLGNHDLLLLSARRLGDEPTTGLGGTFVTDWLRSGGVWADLAALGPNEDTWLSTLPAIARHEEWLLLHADAPFYLTLGGSVAEVNNRLAALARGDDPLAWDACLEAFTVHGAFAERPGGSSLATTYLDVFGGERLIHGHTPVSKLTGQPSDEVTEPLIYNQGRCVDADGGLYRGGPGFVCRLDELDADRDDLAAGLG